MNDDHGNYGVCVFLYDKEIADESCLAAAGDQDCSQTVIDYPLATGSTTMRPFWS